MRNRLYILMSHLDDFELSCLGYLSKSRYKDVHLFVLSDWSPKREIHDKNIIDICDTIDIEIIDEVLDFPQRRLMSQIDDVRHDLYSRIDFKEEFDVLCHDSGDCHTDHVACSMIGKGLYKYASNYVSVYSPSSAKFEANLWTPLSQDIFELKTRCANRYTIMNEESYSKTGYYLNSPSHYDIGRASALENFVRNFEHAEMYSIKKMVL